MEEATAGELLLKEFVFYVVIGLPIGVVGWIWAEQLAELFATRSAPADRSVLIDKRGKSPITGRASHWEQAVADVRYKNDAKVIRGGVVFLLGLWTVRLIWKLVTTIAA